MSEKYNDFLLPEDFEVVAKEYSKKLKNKGFVFIKLQEEEFGFLINEILVLFEKMKACLKRLNLRFDSQKLHSKIDFCQNEICGKYGKIKPHKLKCVASESEAFLSLVSCQNTLTIKSLSLSNKSGDLEFWQNIVFSISKIFAESFLCEGFLPD